MTDGRNWEEVGSELDWQGTDGAALLMGSRTRREIPLDQNTVPATPSPAVDRTGLDQYFAQSAAATDQTTEDE